MKLFLTTAAVAALLCTGAYAQENESRGAPTGQSKETTRGVDDNAGKASSGGAMSTQKSGSGSMGMTTGSGDSKKDTAGSKDNPGQKTGVSGGGSK